MREIVTEQSHLGIVLRGLRDPNSPSTCTSVKFDGGLTEDCTPAQHAAFAADVVDAITPVVDLMLAELGQGQRML